MVGGEGSSEALVFLVSPPFPKKFQLAFAGEEIFSSSVQAQDKLLPPLTSGHRGARRPARRPRCKNHHCSESSRCAWSRLSRTGRARRSRRLRGTLAVAPLYLCSRHPVSETAWKRWALIGAT